MSAGLHYDQGNHHMEDYACYMRKGDDIVCMTCFHEIDWNKVSRNQYTACFNYTEDPKLGQANSKIRICGKPDCEICQHLRTPSD